jgi:hypothetical protein
MLSSGHYKVTIALKMFKPFHVFTGSARRDMLQLIPD